MMWVLFGMGAVAVVGSITAVAGAIWAGAASGGSELAVNVTMSGIAMVVAAVVVGAAALFIASALEVMS